MNIKEKYEELIKLAFEHAKHSEYDDKNSAIRVCGELLEDYSKFQSSSVIENSAREVNALKHELQAYKARRSVGSRKSNKPIDINFNINGSEDIDSFLEQYKNYKSGSTKDTVNLYGYNIDALYELCDVLKKLIESEDK